MYIRQLRVALQGKTGDALKTEEVLLNTLDKYILLISAFLLLYGYSYSQICAVFFLRTKSKSWL